MSNFPLSWNNCLKILFTTVIVKESIRCLWSKQTNNFFSFEFSQKHTHWPPDSISTYFWLTTPPLLTSVLRNHHFLSKETSAAMSTTKTTHWRKRERCRDGKERLDMRSRREKKRKRELLTTKGFKDSNYKKSWCCVSAGNGKTDQQKRDYLHRLTASGIGARGAGAWGVRAVPLFTEPGLSPFHHGHVTDTKDKHQSGKWVGLLELSALPWSVYRPTQNLEDLRARKESEKEGGLVPKREIAIAYWGERKNKKRRSGALPIGILWVQTQGTGADSADFWKRLRHADPSCAPRYGFWSRIPWKDQEDN